MTDDRSAAGIHAARLKLYGANGLRLSRHEGALLARLMDLAGVTELSMLEDRFGHDVDATFRMDEPRGPLYLPERLGMVLQAADLGREWGGQVTSLDLYVRRVT